VTWDLQRRRGLEMNELRQLFVQRLSTVDDRFPDTSESEREFIKSKLRRMLFRGIIYMISLDTRVIIY
jgi:hypothetical protein